jgi:hypothetical protein
LRLTTDATLNPESPAILAGIGDFPDDERRWLAFASWLAD